MAEEGKEGKMIAKIEKIDARSNQKSDNRLEKKEQKEQKQIDLLKKSEVSLWLDHYDDIFSDFDPRPYSQRAISDDLLKEARKATREVKPGVFELRFLVPFAHKKIEEENIIKKRLREHFRKHADLLIKESKERVHKGITLLMLGFLLMICATSIAYLHKEAFLWTLLVVIMEPAGWFTVWNGLDSIFFASKEQRSERLFYEKMTRAEILFDSY